MKNFLWTSALALCTVVCLTACDESSSSNDSADIPTYVNTAALPDSCEMAAAKVDSVYYACFENKWVEVADSATIEKIKDGLDEEELKKELQDLQEALSSAAAQKANNASSSSAAVADEGKNENEDGGIESSSEEASEETGDSSSSEKKSGKDDGDSSSSVKVEKKCGTVVYDPDTQVCEEDVVKGKCGKATYDLDGTRTCESGVLKGLCKGVSYDLQAETCENDEVKGVCGTVTYDLDGTKTCDNNEIKGKCGTAIYDLDGTKICDNNEVKGVCGSATYKLDGTQACENNEVKGVCGTVTYILSDSYTCVNDEVKGVCGTVTYDLDGTKVCVAGEVKGKCGTTTYVLDGTRICENNVVKGVCGSATYDLNGTRTCENGVLKGLCDGVSYDLQTRTCQYGVVVGVCGSATYDLSTETCVRGVVKGKCGSTTYDQETQGCCGSTVYSLDVQFCNLGNNNELLYYCGDRSLFHLYNKNTQVCRTRDAAVINISDKGTCGSDIYSKSNEICDTRDGTGRVYKTVKIGYGRDVLQTWMAENLNYNSSSYGSICYGLVAGNCDKYGRLYNWSAANSGICPSGWRLPTRSDFETLIVNADTMITSYTQNRQSGANLKGGEGWSNYWYDMYGFTALPAGYSTSNYSSNCSGLNGEARFWSSSTMGGSAYYMVLSDNESKAGIDYMPTSYYASVRCIKNE